MMTRKFTTCVRAQEKVTLNARRQKAEFDPREGIQQVNILSFLPAITLLLLLMHDGDDLFYHRRV